MAQRTVLCVSNLHPDNRVFLQDIDTSDYFRGVHRWTSEVNDALRFVDVAEVYHICRYLGMKCDSVPMTDEKAPSRKLIGAVIDMKAQTIPSWFTGTTNLDQTIVR